MSHNFYVQYNTGNAWKVARKRKSSTSLNFSFKLRTFYLASILFYVIKIRDFKIQRRGRQRERHKNNRFNKQNNNFASASHFFVHFFPVFARLRRENA